MNNKTAIFNTLCHMRDSARAYQAAGVYGHDVQTAFAICRLFALEIRCINKQTILPPALQIQSS